MTSWVAMRRKALISALGTVALAIQGAASAGMTGQELAVTLIGALTTAAVYVVSNAPPDPPLDDEPLTDPTQPTEGLQP